MTGAPPPPPVKCADDRSLFSKRDCESILVGARCARKDENRAVHKMDAEIREWSSMATEGYESIQRNPNYIELVRQRSTLGWTLAAIMLIIYFGFILLIAYAPKFLGTPIGAGVMTIGIPIGLAVIVSAFLLVGIYVLRANATYDRLTREIVKESR
jgi:uncharacterized membrane protein (DUF485 family)